MQIIRKRLAKQGIHARWQTLRAIFNVQQRVTTTFRRADGLILHVITTTRAELEDLSGLAQGVNDYALILSRLIFS